MTLNEYSVLSAQELAECSTQADANLIVTRIENDIEGLTETQKNFLWRELNRLYREAPKPFVEETISAAKLNQLQAAVQLYLQGKSGN